jgi:hypothetical protein
MFGKVVRNIPAFSKNFCDQTLNKLALKMELKKFAPGEEIYFSNID